MKTVMIPQDENDHRLRFSAAKKSYFQQPVRLETRSVRAGEKIFIVLQLRIDVDLFKLKLEIKLYFLSEIIHSSDTMLNTVN